jgi:hypothetical protein
MDKFDDLIKKSLLSQDGQEPEEGHYRRFEKRLKYSEMSSSKQFSYSLLRIAAVIAIGILIGSASYLYFTINSSEQELAVLSPELQETLYYYDNVSKNYLSGIESLPQQNPDLIKTLSQELQEYENEYNILLSELTNFPGDERIIHAIIENQRLKAELLSFLFGQLAESKNITK